MVHATENGFTVQATIVNLKDGQDRRRTVPRESGSVYLVFDKLTVSSKSSSAAQDSTSKRCEFRIIAVRVSYLLVPGQLLLEKLRRGPLVGRRRGTQGPKIDVSEDF